MSGEPEFRYLSVETRWVHVIDGFELSMRDTWVEISAGENVVELGTRMTYLLFPFFLGILMIVNFLMFGLHIPRLL